MQIYKTIIQKGMKWQGLAENTNVLSLKHLAVIQDVADNFIRNQKYII